MNAQIEATDLTIRFLFDRQRRVVTPRLAKLRRRGSEAFGLRDVSLRIGPGEGVALLGPSGSGKTTLLRSIAGILVPDAGHIDVRGHVGSLLSVDAGLMGQLTGRENCLLLGVLAGLSRAQTRAELEVVKAAAMLGENFERPASSYSEGMRARLGFAAAIRSHPDVLLLDEVHEAFDHEYRDVVERYGKELVAAGGIVVAAGHDHEMLQRLCGRALLFDRGRLAEDGEFEAVRRRYLAGEHEGRWREAAFRVEA